MPTNKYLYPVALILFGALAALTPRYSFQLDQQAFMQWCQYIFKYGITEIHSIDEPMFNYPPLISYVLWMFGKLMGSADNISEYFYLLKIFALAFDFIAALLVARQIKSNTWQLVAFIALAANPIFIYNAYWWAQYDGVLSCLVFISFLLLIKQQLQWAIFFFVLSINFKFQAIIFLPPLALLALLQLRNIAMVKKFAVGITISILVQVLILLPFILHGKLAAVAATISYTVQFSTTVTHTAHNMWVLIFSRHSSTILDTEMLGPVMYKYIGAALFCIGSFFALLPMLAIAVNQYIFKRKKELKLDTLAISFALIPLLFFYFNTQMHERYSHPALIFIALFSFRTKTFLPFVLMCTAYIGNNEQSVQVLHLPNYKILFFDRIFVSLLYAVLICLLYYYLYKPNLVAVNKQHEQQLT